MELANEKRAVGAFSSYSQAEAALHELQEHGFSMQHVSIVGRNPDDHQAVGSESRDLLGEGPKQAAQDTQTDEGAKTGAMAGSAIGGLTGLLVGLGALAIPGVGPVVVGGAVATALATTLTGGAVGAAAGGLVGGLVGLGIPEDRATAYQDRIAQGEYLVMIEGNEEQIQRAEAILHSRGIADWGVFEMPIREQVMVNQPIDSAVTPDYSGYPAGTLYPSGSTPVSEHPAGTLYPTGDLSNVRQNEQGHHPAGTLYPSTGIAEVPADEQTNYPAGTLYPPDMPYPGTQDEHREDPLV